MRHDYGPEGSTAVRGVLIGLALSLAVWGVLVLALVLATHPRPSTTHDGPRRPTACRDICLGA